MGPAPKPPAELFWAKVNKTEGCWLWTASLSGNRPGGIYGKFYWNRRWTGAHRVAYMLTTGPIPKGQRVLHSCDTPLCVRPDHLFLGTQADNVADMVQKGRQYTRPLRGEENGRAKLTEAAVYAMRDDYANGVGFSALAAHFGVTEQNARLIVTGKTWKNVPFPAAASQ